MRVPEFAAAIWFPGRGTSLPVEGSPPMEESLPAEGSPLMEESLRAEGSPPMEKSLLVEESVPVDRVHQNVNVSGTLHRTSRRKS
ncbi:unnamed protein product [Merluccius merluccius]